MALFSDLETGRLNMFIHRDIVRTALCCMTDRQEFCFAAI